MVPLSCNGIDDLARFVDGRDVEIGALEPLPFSHHADLEQAVEKCCEKRH